MLHIDMENDQASVGFTFLEILLVLSIGGLLYLGFFNFFLESVWFFYGLNERSEIIHQFRSGIEGLVRELQDANPLTISYLERDFADGRYTQIQFYKYGSSTQYWFYLNTAGSLIRAVQVPGSSWGRTALATHIDHLYFADCSGLIQIQLTTDGKGLGYSLNTGVVPGF